ncbi:MAG TPA: sigma-54 dependent transcriptional regulator [Fimbriimonadaceae bacterium]|nr:sigma-54 dependent transcriptional regulator [Fimbriimonadaceae bacterium]HRJ96024.1 sigma-54 dependent transcriptional regulator [Fimbriimonadaceae bacterium]
MSKGKRILIVDDEPNIRRVLESAFEKEGFRTATAEDGRQALERLESEAFDVMITDVTMPGMTGYEVQREAASLRPEMPVIVMTAYGTIPQAIQAIRDGAYEFVTKPFDLDHLKKVVASALQEEKKASLGKKASVLGPDDFIATSPVMQEVVQTVEQIADSRATVFITGESGCGKEVVAKLIHRLSPRNRAPFVAVSCAALPETLLESELFGYEKGAFTGANGSKIGRFEAADGGTLFLDEIGEIPASVQVKLLRVLQEREFERLGATKPTRVDVRLITATNRDLQAAVDEGTFRLDLLYRLQVIELHLPPLRERGEDIRVLAEHFLRRYSAENVRSLTVVGDAAYELMSRYRWPGNVRELENAMERAVVLAGPADEILTPSLLPASLRRAA